MARGKKKTKGLFGKKAGGYGKDAGEKDQGMTAGPHSPAAGGEKKPPKFGRKFKK